MRFMRRKEVFQSFEPPLEDPLTGVANLFDASVVFIVSMMIALFMAWNLIDMLNPKSELTITKKTSDGKIEIITKKGKEIKVQRVTDKKLKGEGIRLGTAYQLKDGRIVYVPD
ncbi:MAG: DUF2149 domain-containing protein [Caldimicrobium sp.]